MYKISDFFFQNGYTDFPLTITIEVLTRERLEKINQELFYKYNEGKGQELEDVDEINVSIRNINFKYVLKKDDSEDQE